MGKLEPVHRAAPGPLARRVAWFFGTGAGLGYSPVASGTVGSLWGLLLVGLIRFLPGWGWHLAAASALTVLAVPVCHAAESLFGRKDDGRIVADEYMTFPLCTIGLPFEPLTMAVAFVTNRIFDILKPPPANRLQDLEGGLGIVADDAVASLYSLALNHLLYHVVLSAL